MEFCDFSLTRFIGEFPDIKMSLKIDLAIQMSQGIIYLHDKGYTHKDIKPNNFLLKTISKSRGKLTIKLADVGLSKRLMDSPIKLTSKLDNEAQIWLAPELFNHPYHFVQASDVWAFGCVIFYSFTRGKHPFDNPGKNTLTERRASKKKFSLTALENADLTQIDSDIHQRLQLLISPMIDSEPSSRPVMKEVLNQLSNLENSNKQSVNAAGSSGSNQPRKEGRIEYIDTEVLGEGSQLSVVFDGTFTDVTSGKKLITRPCAVKRVIKDKGGKESEECNKLKLAEITTQIELSKNTRSVLFSTALLPIVRCYGFEENSDFW